MLNDINHTALVEEWKLNLDATAYEKKIDANVNRPSDKKEIDHHGRKVYWPIITKETIQWFPFQSIVDHTEGIIETYISLIPSLLKGFAMYQMPLFYYKHNKEDNVVEAIAIKCSNCDISTGLF